jgi:ABC-2 type transport system permease protein
MSLRRLSAVVLKELRQLARDRMTVALMAGIPALQLVLFGYAINLDVRNLPATTADMAATTGSRALLADLYATGVVAPVARADAPQQALAQLRRGQASVALVVPADFERRVGDGRPVLQVLVDGSDASVQQAALRLAQYPLDGVATAPRVAVLPLYNPERRSAVNIVPALIGVILTLTMVLFTAVALVRERERGNLELLITTPVTRLELMGGKVLPYIAIGLVQTSIVLGLGMLLFSVPVRGSLLDVYLAALLLIAANLALGLLISTRSRTQFQAMQMTFFVFLPSLLLSGFMFPFAGMPKLAQWIAELLPLTHFVRLIRGVMLRGATLGEQLPEVLALAAFAVLVMAVATLRFRKTLD